MNVWTEPSECALCGTTGRDIHMQLVKWVEALPGMQYEHVARCDDRPVCRARFVANAKENNVEAKWPVIEGRAA